MRNVLRWLFFVPLAILAGGISYYVTYTIGWWFIIPEWWILVKSVETTALLSGAYTFIMSGLYLCPSPKVGGVILHGVILLVVIVSVLCAFLGYLPLGWDVWDITVFAGQNLVLGLISAFGIRNVYCGDL